MGASLPPVALRAVAPLRHRLTFGVLGGDVGTQGLPGQNTTSYLTIAIPDDAYAVRIGLAQMDSNTNPYTITKAIFCPSTTFDAPDYVNPTGGQAWAPFTWDYLGADSELPVYTSANTSFTVPAGPGTADPNTGATNIPRVYWSDWAPIVASNWGPTPGVKALFTRVLWPATSQTFTRATRALAGWTGVPSVNQGYDLFLCNLNTDSVTSPNNAVGTGNAFSIVYNPIYALQVMSRTAGVQIMAMGDSHIGGDKSDANMDPFWVKSALSLSSPKLPVMPWNTAHGGQPSATFFPLFMGNLAAGCPSIVVLQGWSANDSPPSLWYNGIARVLSAAQKALTLGALPIITTPLPRGSIAQANLAIWTDIRTRLLNSGTSAEIFDVLPIVGNQSSPGVYDGTYLPGLSTDGVHPNSAGHAALAARFKPFLRRVIGL
ncbi:MAG TPA: SGNH/GDSL hydrolase family protein [Rhodopila sp.]